MKIKTWLIGLSLMAAAFVQANGADPITIELTHNGQPAATIVTAEKPTRAAQLAAAELQEHVRKISGAILPVVSDTNDVKGTRILVGESEATRKLGLHSKDFKPQEYLIRFQRNVLVLMGRDKQDYEKLDYNDPSGKTIPDIFDEQATCYAVYDFLERHCDVRWYLPTELGLVCPQVETLRVTGSERRRAPWMEYRYTDIQNPFSAAGGGRRFPKDLIGAIFSGAPGAELMAWREQALYAHRLRLGGKRMSVGGHSFYGYYPRFRGDSRYPEYFESSHPEFFAKGYKGEPPQMCYTSPELVQQTVKDARDFFNGKAQRMIINEGSAGQDNFALGAMDNCSWCKCPRCNAIIRKNLPPDSDQYDIKSLNDYFYQFVNKIARETKKSHPDKMLITMSYGVYTYPPVLERLEPNVAIALVFEPRRGVWCKPSYNEYMKVIDTWVKESKERPKYLYLHYSFPAEGSLWADPVWYPFPGFFAHQIVQQMKVYQNAGVRGMVTGGTYAPPHEQHLPLWDQLEMYVNWQLADDPEKDGNQLIDEFFERYYGAAAKPMKAFYEMAEEIYCNSNNYPYGARDESPKIAWEYLGNEPRMEKLGRLMDEALAACRTETEKKRVELFDKGIWQVMCAGRNKYLEYKTLADVTMQSAHAPYCEAPPAGRDPRKVDWVRAGILENWRSFDGKTTERKIEGRVAHDGEYLYLRLQEQMDTKKIVRDGTSVWGGDDWEIFLARRCSAYDPYRQMGIDVHGAHIDNAISVNEMNEPEWGLWDSGVQVYSDAGAPDCWSVYVALPLDKLLAGRDKIKTGDTIYMDIVRSTLGTVDGAVMWIPTLARNFHAADRLGRIVLENSAK